ncbi:MAG: rRNA maturation RNase YbeY [Lentisphaerae bacterium]|nr:rRNA maturation RNase YbeY [Lentisphaerota bacterium]MCP4101555.1 rRNA maturation RNase YbeY [Lentisphaerota bacterium]
MQPPRRTQLKKLILRAAELSRLPVEQELLINITFVGDRTMAAYNQDYVGHEGTTDVITFCYLEGDEPLLPGDVAIDLMICADFAIREGAERKDSCYARELALYIVHGLLHSAGEDDLDPVSRKRMRRREREVMKKLEQEMDFSGIFPDNKKIKRSIDI